MSTSITRVEVGHYRIPLPVALSDSTHGMIHHFELVTVQIVDVAGLEGVGYAYTVGTNGAAVRSLIADDLRPLVGVASDEIKAVWQKMCWRSGGARVARSRAQL